MPAGYSQTPLVKKLGYTEDFKVALGNAPEDYAEILGELPSGVTFHASLSKQIDLVHAFVVDRADLAKRLKRFREALRDDVIVWISWPKKSAKVPTTVTEDVIRELALPLGFVDIKVCAVTEVWSGLKLVVRKELRK